LPIQQDFLKSQDCSPQIINEVAEIIKSIGFKDELPSSSDSAVPCAMSTEAMIVQDADRWDFGVLFSSVLWASATMTWTVMLALSPSYLVQLHFLLCLGWMQ
jgi:hypothetical protein